MQDYKKIADGDPGGDMQSAYELMAAETEPGLKTLTGNELRIWAGINPSDYNALKDAAVNHPIEAIAVAAEMAVALIQSPDSTLTMGRPEVDAMISGLTGAGVMSDDGKQALEEMAATTTKKYPGLIQSHLSKARTMRAEGRV